MYFYCGQVLLKPPLKPERDPWFYYSSIQSEKVRCCWLTDSVWVSGSLRLASEPTTLGFVSTAGYLTYCITVVLPQYRNIQLKSCLLMHIIWRILMNLQKQTLEQKPKTNTVCCSTSNFCFVFAFLSWLWSPDKLDLSCPPLWLA